VEVEDLGIKVVSKDEALWTEVKEAAEKELESIEDNYFRTKTFQTAIRELCINKLAEISNDK